MANRADNLRAFIERNRELQAEYANLASMLEDGRLQIGSVQVSGSRQDDSKTEALQLRNVIAQTDKAIAMAERYLLDA